MGLRRNLTAAEIVDQAVFARRLLTSEVGSITNVVFMVHLQLSQLLIYPNDYVHNQRLFHLCGSSEKLVYFC